MANVLHVNGYTDTKIVELGFWVNGGEATIPTNHYAVTVKKEGIEIVIDLTAGQDQEFSGPIFDTKDNWIHLWQKAMKNKPRTLVKMAFVTGGLESSTFSAFSPFAYAWQTAPNGELIQSPTWYKNANCR